MSRRRANLASSVAVVTALAWAYPAQAQLLTIDDLFDQITAVEAQVTLNGQAILNNSNAIISIGADLSLLNTNVVQIQADLDANSAVDAVQDTQIAAVEAQTGVNTGAIAALDVRLATNEVLDGVQNTQIAAIDGRVTTVETQTGVNTGAIAALDVRLGANDALDGVQSTQITAIDGRVTVVESQTGISTGAIATLGARLDINDLRDVAHDVTLADHTQRLDSHDGQLATLDGRLDINELQDVAQDVLLADHTQRLDGHDAQLATLDVRLSANDARDNGQDARLDGHDGQLASQDARLTANDARDDRQDIVLNDHGQRLDGHDTQLASHDARLIANNVRDDGQDVRLGGHDTQLASLDQRLVVNDARDDTQALLLVEHDARIWTAQGTADAAAADAANLRNAIVAGQIGLVQQASYSAPVTVAAATGGDYVSFAGQAGDRRLGGVAAGVNANDAVNLSQMQLADAAILSQARSYTDSSIADLSFDLGRLTQLVQYNDRELREEIEAASAGAAALAGLPQAFQPGKGMVAIGIGGRGSNTAFAIGVGKAFNSPNTPVLRAGAAIDARRGDVTYNAAVGFHF